MLELPLELEQKITEIAGADNFFTFAPAPGKKDAGCRIVRPGSVEGLSEIVRLCSAARVPMYPSGGRAESLPEACRAMLVLSLERLNRVLDVDLVARTITLEAGCTFADARRAADEAGFLFPLYMNAADEAQVGSRLASNVIHTAASRYGAPKDLTLGLRLVLPDGTIRDGLKNYANAEADMMKNLFVGSQGRLGFIAGATLKLHPKPVEVRRMLCGMPNVAGVPKLFALSQHLGATLLTGFDLFSKNGFDRMRTRSEAVKNPLSEECAWYVLIELSSTVQNDRLPAFLNELKNEAVQKGLIREAFCESNGELAVLSDAVRGLAHPSAPAITREANVPVSKVAETVGRLALQMQYSFPSFMFMPMARVGEGALFLNVQPTESGKGGEILTEEGKLYTLFDETVRQAGGSLAEQQDAPSPDHPLSGVPEAMDMFRAVRMSFDPYGLMKPEKK